MLPLKLGYDLFSQKSLEKDGGVKLAACFAGHCVTGAQRLKFMNRTHDLIDRKIYSPN
jgi:hypothetical protein